MKRKLMLLVFTLVIALVSNQATLATTGANNGVSPNGTSYKEWVPLAEKLNLTDTQVKQLKEINRQTHEATKTLKIKLLDAKYELRQMGIEGTNKAAMEAKIKEIKELKAQLDKVKQDRWQKTQSILTPEQQSKLKEMKKSTPYKGHWQNKCKQ